MTLEVNTLACPPDLAAPVLAGRDVIISLRGSVSIFKQYSCHTALRTAWPRSNFLKACRAQPVQQGAPRSVDCPGLTVA